MYQYSSGLSSAKPVTSGLNVDEPKLSRSINLTLKLRDADNSEKAELLYQRKAVKSLNTHEEQDLALEDPPNVQSQANRSDISPSTASVSAGARTTSAVTNDGSRAPTNTNASSHASPHPKRAITMVSDDDSDGSGNSDAQPKPRMAQCCLSLYTFLIHLA